MSAGLQAVGLRRRYGRRVALADLSLTVAPGEVVGLLGPNGAGKTTAFRLLAGLLRPHGGRVHLGGVEITRWPLWRRARAGLGYLPQGPTVLGDLTAAENVALGLRGHPGGRPARRARAHALLDAWALGHLADARGASLSGGERRRVEIVRALAAEPRVLLVDEPFAGLDPRAVGAVADALQGLAERGVGVLLTDHHARQALEACSRLYIVVDGALLFAGSSAAAAHNPAVCEHYLGGSAGLAGGGRITRRDERDATL